MHRRAGFVTTLDPNAPAAGLAVVGETPAAAGSHPVDHLLGLELGAACRAADHWLRGADVTAVYEPADPRRLRATAMWRLHAGPGHVAACELIVSAQTSLLHSAPGVAVVSDVAGDELLWSGGRSADTSAEPRHWTAAASADGPPPDHATCGLVRRAATADRAASSVLLAIHPGDMNRIGVQRRGGRIHLECRLFSAAIEKGVLLRSRVLAAIGPADGDAVWADRLIAEFEASPAPLTT